MTKNTKNPKQATSKSITEPRKEKLFKNKRFFLQSFELHANLKGFNKGAIIPLKCHKSTKLPMDPYWRRRLKDASMDGCITKAAPIKAVEAIEEIKDKNND